MLPDFPKQKKRLDDLLMEVFLSEVQKQMGPFGGIRETIMHEGDLTSIKREDGIVDEMQMQELAVEMSIDRNKLEDITLDEIIQKVKDSAKLMAEKKKEMIYTEMNRITTEVGNVIDNKGRALTPDTLLELYKLIEMDFDKYGNAKDGQFIVVSPDLFEKMKEIVKEFETNPKLQQRLKEQKQKKLEEFYARENSRKLVD